MKIHIQTPAFLIIYASDIGEIKAATALAKAFPDEKVYRHVNQDNPERWCKVMRIEKGGKTILI